MESTAASWEARLEAEGLGVVADVYRSQPFHGMTMDQVTAHQRAVEQWQAWAQTVLETHLWWNDHEREVWRLYAQGVSTRRIPALVARTAAKRRPRDVVSQKFVSDGRPGSRARIQVLIGRIKREHPGPPSPWTRRSLSAAPCRAQGREPKPARKDRA